MTTGVWLRREMSSHTATPRHTDVPPANSTPAAGSRTVKAAVDLASLLTARAKSSPERSAITFEGETRTFGQIHDRVERLAAVLHDGGVTMGDRVAYLGLNHPAILEALFATASLGAIFVPLNFRLTGPELAYAINHSAVHTLIADADHTGLIDGQRGVLSVERYLMAAGGEPPPDWEDVERLCTSSAPRAHRTDILPDDPAVIMYTSGTTGRPKGATLTHANLWWNNIAVVLALDIAYDDVSIVCAPLFHIGALNSTAIATWIKGGRLVVHRTFDPQAVLDSLVAQRATTMFGVPVMCQAIASLPNFATADLSALRLIITGGAPVPVGVIRTFQGQGVELAQGYGLTEASPIASFLTADYALKKIGSAGRPTLFCDVRIVDGAGVVVDAPGVTGEIQVRGPNVTPGYWNNAVATAATFDGEWLKTGDGGYRDEDGFLFVADRIKDMIISGGENIYPAEVEDLLFDHPLVAEAAVIGIADDHWGERVCAVIAVAGDAPSLDELREFMGGRLARYKLPRQLEIVDSLPRNATGKVLKTELRARFDRSENDLERHSVRSPRRD
ncbi:MAG: fatty-acyl-CoA synthase [Mycobacterium sp.]|jgi:fatty-acyl-CoA synthase|nr:fatty-acyl-CoA synthase [Mycobacterium sp.]